MITNVATPKEQQNDMNMPHNINEIPVPSKNSAMQALLNGRSELTETRLAVTAAQIVERLRMRASHLSQLMDEELAVDSKLLNVRESGFGGGTDMMNLESLLEQQSSQIRSAQRRENTECWRDLTMVIRDLLNAWEGFSRDQAKNRFITALPGSGYGPDTKNAPSSIPYTNDHYTNYPGK
jgi:hypothetical protein